MCIIMVLAVAMYQKRSIKHYLNQQSVDSEQVMLSSSLVETEPDFDVNSKDRLLRY